jgi:hypothetical protein
MAVCAPWIRSDGHAPAGVATQAKLTFETGHSMGADQLVHAYETDYVMAIITAVVRDRYLPV